MEDTRTVSFTENEIGSLARKISSERIARGARERDRNGDFPWEEMRVLGECGLVGMIVSETAMDVANKAIQVMGGYGYCRDFTVERLFRDARGLMLHFKTSEWLRQDVATAALGL